jgi:hypothetical protein
MTVFNLTLLGWLLRGKIGNLGTTLLIKPFCIMMVGSLATGLIAYFAYSFIYPQAELFGHVACATAVPPAQALMNAACSVLHRHAPIISSSQVVGFLTLFLSLGLASIPALCAYVGVCALFKLEELSTAMKRLGRSRA